MIDALQVDGLFTDQHAAQSFSLAFSFEELLGLIDQQCGAHRKLPSLKLFKQPEPIQLRHV